MTLLTGGFLIRGIDNRIILIWDRNLDSLHAREEPTVRRIYNYSTAQYFQHMDSIRTGTCLAIHGAYGLTYCW